MVAIGGRGLLSRNGWHRIDVQLGGALLLALVFPSAVAGIMAPVLVQQGLFVASVASSLLAIVGGYWFFRNLISFPGIRASYYVLPVFTSTFGVAVAILFLFRIEYSRPLLIAGFVLSVFWCYLVYFMIQRRQRLYIGVVPFCRADQLFEIPQIIWRRLETPTIPRDCRAIAADFHFDLAPEWESFLAECALQGVSVFHYKNLRQSLTGQVAIEHLSENTFGSLIPNASYVGVKLIFDIVGAVITAVLIAPLMVLVALIIKLDSPGPVFFRQTRIGYRGQPFKVWKFRTMTNQPVGAPATDAKVGAITQAGDKRITRVGRVLRHYRIDELPQLFNVMVGEMSWIGPRPEAEVLSHWYQREIPFYRYRHIVRPGISGWAQVNQGHVAELDDVLTKLTYDFYYISNFSFWLDVLIVVRTIKTMLTGFGSR